MKVKFLRPYTIRHPDLTDAALTKLRLDYVRGKITRAEFEARRELKVEAGHVLDHPKAFLLVALGGIAEPYDLEALRRCGTKTDEKVEREILARDKLERAQSTGDEEHDATDDDVADFQATLQS